MLVLKDAKISKESLVARYLSVVWLEAGCCELMGAGRLVNTCKCLVARVLRNFTKRWSFQQRNNEISEPGSAVFQMLEDVNQAVHPFGLGRKGQQLAWIFEDSFWW